MHAKKVSKVVAGGVLCFIYFFSFLSLVHIIVNITGKKHACIITRRRLPLHKNTHTLDCFRYLLKCMHAFSLQELNRFLCTFFIHFSLLMPVQKFPVKRAINYLFVCCCFVLCSNFLYTHKQHCLTLSFTQTQTHTQTWLLACT